jgi:ABC-type uncharacterized transport system permease subunit
MAMFYIACVPLLLAVMNMSLSQRCLPNSRRLWLRGESLAKYCERQLLVRAAICIAIYISLVGVIQFVDSISTMQHLLPHCIAAALLCIYGVYSGYVGAPGASIELSLLNGIVGAILFGVMLIILLVEQNAELVVVELIAMLGLVVTMRTIAQRRWQQLDWRVCTRLLTLADFKRGQM